MHQSLQPGQKLASCPLCERKKIKVRLMKNSPNGLLICQRCYDSFRSLKCSYEFSREILHDSGAKCA